ncbi:MAG: hypothetical protein KDA52_09390 [Planctomycetaceae bacterium]|nr:hypothetical protein [Planctomycetaceae bacterium]
MTKLTSTIFGLTLVTLLPVTAVQADDAATDAPKQTAFLNQLFAPFRPNYYTPTAYVPSARYGNTGTFCTNGRCYTTPSSACANGQCGTYSSSYCPNGQCGTYPSSYCPNGQCGTGVGYRPAPVYRPTVTPVVPYGSNYITPSTQYGPIQFNTTPVGTNYAPVNSNAPFYGGY